MPSKSWEDRREEQRKFEADVTYDVWRSGGDVDRINWDRVEDQRYAGAYADEAADLEVRRQRPRPQDEE
jgi:hypothetical protein